MATLIFNWRFQKVAVPLCSLGFASVKAFSSNMGNEDWKKAQSVYDFTVKDIKGNDVPLEKYKGHVLVIVNVASQCGLTKDNYKELVELDEKYRESKGLRILAFPCNQFGGQEPGSNDEICTFVSKHNAKFDFFDKIDVNGDNAHPLWKYLKHKQGGTLGDSIKWNFTKFIVDKNGQPVERFAPTTPPHKLTKVTIEPKNELNQILDWKKAKSVYEFVVKDINKNDVSLKKYRGHVLLIVNVASECGLTESNYEELVNLDKKYYDSKGLRILAFPCNQFGEQEPGSNEAILKFATSKGVLFDIFDKINVNGKNAHPLWKYLKLKQGKKAIEWNFAKFIVDRKGQVVRRFDPEISPLELVDALEEYW